MTATVVLCVLSTVSFCVLMRIMVQLLTSRSRPGRRLQAELARSRYSQGAWRLARQYATFAIGILTVMSFLGAVHSYIELFN